MSFTRNSELLPSFVKDLPDRGNGLLSLFDADGTLWVDDVADDFTKYALQNGLLPRGGLWDEYLEIYAKHPPSGCRFLLHLYEGMLRNEVVRMAEDWWEKNSKRNWVGEVMESMYDLSDRGYRIWVVTASPTDLIAPIEKFLPVERVIGIDFEVDSENRITGSYAGILCAAAGKAEKVLSLSENSPILFSAGNSSMDIPMIEISSQVKWAIYPNEEFKKQAEEKAWPILPRPEDFKEEAKFLI